MTIELKNVAVRVVHQNSIACMISISRLTDDQKKLLRNMFPSAIGPSGEIDGCSEMTITAGIPHFSSVSIHDSDMCNLVITDGMIESQRDTAYLTAVAVKVQPQSKTIRIGRICENEKLRIERIMPPYNLNWISPSAIKSYELTIHYKSDIDVKDSNVCRLTIACDETQSDSICILDQDLSIQNTPFSNWFGSDDSESSNDENNSKEETDKENKKMNELISLEKLVDIFQKWIDSFIPENKDKRCFGIGSSRFYWSLDGKQIGAQRCTDDNGTAYWRIYQNVNFDQPCLEIFPDHIRLHSESGYFKAFSIDAIRDLGYMIEKKCSEDKEAICLDQVKKEENTVRIDLENVAVRVEHQNPHDYCIISIGRLNALEKNKLLSMFPTTSYSLKCTQYPTLSLYQVTITAILQNISDLKICDSDVCNISIMDRMIISQTESADKNIYKQNWFGSVYSNHDNGIKKVRLSYVAVKVVDKAIDRICVRIGRISESEKEQLEQILSPKTLNFKSRRIPGTSIDHYEIELGVPLTDIEDSNNCTIEVLYDERHPNVICISHQHLFTSTMSSWFESTQSDMAKVKCTRLSGVAVKVDNDFDDLKFIRIGRISEHEKEMLEQILPSNMIHFRLKVMGTIDYYYELAFKVPTADNIKDSNNCAVDISYDESKSKFICISDQRLFTGSLPTWFESNAYFVTAKDETGSKKETVSLSSVAIKVTNKRGKCKFIRIGRISWSEKERLEQILPPNMLHFNARAKVTTFGSVDYYELDLHAQAEGIVDSNNASIKIEYDKSHPYLVYITNQECLNDALFSPWFLSIAQRLSPPKVFIPDELVKPARQIIAQNKKEETNMTTATLERCIINDNATVLFWSDGTKTITKTTPGDMFDPEIGIAMGIAKRVFGSKHKFDKYVNAVVSDMYKRNAASFTEKELLDALAENEKIITKAKAKHNAEKAAYITAKNDPNHEGKLPELHSLKGDHFYRFAKIRKDIILEEIEKRKEKKAAKAKAKAAKAKKSDKK